MCDTKREFYMIHQYVIIKRLQICCGPEWNIFEICNANVDVHCEMALTSYVTHTSKTGTLLWSSVTVNPARIHIVACVLQSPLESTTCHCPSGGHDDRNPGTTHAHWWWGVKLHAIGPERIAIITLWSLLHVSNKVDWLHLELSCSLRTRLHFYSNTWNDWVYLSSRSVVWHTAFHAQPY